MIELDNAKIDGIRAHWARFPGFSFLFDTPNGHHLAGNHLQVLGIRDFSHPDFSLYQQMKQVADSLENEFQQHLFCAMPPSTYHVTVFDGINAANENQVGRQQSVIQSWLEELPQSTTDLPDTLQPLLTSELATKNWDISFRFKKFRFVNHKVIVCDLEPADDHSAENLERLRAAREALYQQLEELTAVNALTPYEPHVTLGYFASTMGGRSAESLVPEWEKRMRTDLGSATLRLSRARFYSFTDMVRFYPLPLS